MQFLVIARIAEGTSPDKALPYIKPEAKKVWEYYAADVVRSIYYIADMSGAVLIIEADSLKTTQEIVAKFPMAENNVLNFEILSLKPYTGLKALFAR